MHAMYFGRQKLSHLNTNIVLVGKHIGQLNSFGRGQFRGEPHQPLIPLHGGNHVLRSLRSIVRRRNYHLG